MLESEEGLEAIGGDRLVVDIDGEAVVEPAPLVDHDF